MTEKLKMKRRDGIKFAFGEPDPDMIVVSMIEFQGRIYVATQKGVYVIKGDTLVRLELVDGTDDRNRDTPKETQKS